MSLDKTATHHKRKEGDCNTGFIRAHLGAPSSHLKRPSLAYGLRRVLLGNSRFFSFCLCEDLRFEAGEVSKQREEIL